VKVALRQLRRENLQSRYVFNTERGGPVTRAWFLKMVRRTGELAKLSFPVHPHMLRHGCGYALANAGHDTRALQAWLGHKNIQHTVRYTELSPHRFKDFWRWLSLAGADFLRLRCPIINQRSNGASQSRSCAK
jgi:site-specific recombinase XerD